LPGKQSIAKIAVDLMTHTYTNSAIFAALDIDAKIFTMSNISAATKLVTVATENKASTGPREARRDPERAEEHTTRPYDHSMGKGVAFH
jgi:hypothetical protein